MLSELATPSLIELYSFPHSHFSLSFIVFAFSTLHPSNMRTGLLIPLSTVFLLNIAQATRYVIPAAPASGPSNVSYQYGSHGLDAPMISPINSTAYEWWYFDAVQSQGDGQYSSLTFVFYSASAGGFDLVTDTFPNQSIDLVGIDISFPNNTVYSRSVNCSEMILNTDENGIIGTYPNADITWTVSPDLSSAKISINAPEIAVFGTVEFFSLAPPRAPCSAASPTANLQTVPHSGWVSAFPDAKATAQLTIVGTLFTLDGYGYHDKNWGDAPFNEAIQQEYWGHAHVGCYSVVWFVTITPQNQTKVGSYVAEDGKIVEISCDDLYIRPSGPGAAYPPRQADAAPEGFQILINIPAGPLNMTVSVDQTVVAGGPLYYRWTGSVVATLSGKQLETGVAMFEQFSYV